jgi:subtilisin-like proprotein convertase family protein
MKEKLMFILYFILLLNNLINNKVNAIAPRTVTLNPSTNAPKVLSATSDSMTVIFDSYYTAIGGELLSYELSQRSLFNSKWDLVNNNIGMEGFNISVSQIVSIRVDDGQTLNSGSFRLSLIRNSNFGEDFEDPVRTPNIPWDATSAQMKTALTSISNVIVREVKRCDEFGNNMDEGHGGVEGWIYGCPYQTKGGFQWLVTFDVEAMGSTLPLLYQYRNELQPNTWTGVGNQITITHLRKGMVNPTLCLKGICTFVVKGLEEGTPYGFRYRSLTDISGWSEYSAVSEFELTDENRPPPKPRPPTLSIASMSRIILLVNIPLSSPKVTRVYGQYRRYKDDLQNKWVNGPVLNLNTSKLDGYYTLLFDKLDSKIEYEFRVRSLNNIGFSPYSAPSTPFYTLVDSSNVLTPLSPENSGDSSSISSTYIDVNIKSNANDETEIGTVDYKVQYKTEKETNWHSLQDSVSFFPKKEGVEVQEVITRSDSFDGVDAKCDGYFWLRLGTVETDKIDDAVTQPIKFDATANEMEYALRTITKIKIANPRIFVRRSSNIYNGYTWNIELQGMGDISKFQLYKHTLFATLMTPQVLIGAWDPVQFINTTTVIPAGSPYANCWSASINAPVISRTVQEGDDTILKKSKLIRINNLKPETSYLIRSQYIDLNSNPGPISPEVVIKTKSIVKKIEFNDPNYKSNALSSNLMADPARSTGIPQGPSVTVSGIGNNPAKQNDYYYIPGSGMGGLSGQSGSNGLCVLLSYNPRKEVPYNVKNFYFTGIEQKYEVPIDNVVTGHISLLTIKCWGGGGGGGKLTDLNEIITDKTALSKGGGGAYAQVSFHVKPKDVITFLVGGGGKPSTGDGGAKGGFGGGGDGGNGIKGGGGGGGGGASVIKIGDSVILVASGGGGGGSTDYCCADGGSGGSTMGYDGTYSGDVSEWPLTDTDANTPVRRRFEYTASACPDDLSGQWCISVWDILPKSLPSQHKALHYGVSPNSNYSTWATSGYGASDNEGGKAGDSGSFSVRLTGAMEINMIGQVAVFSQGKGTEGRAANGVYFRGGNGGGGKEGGGGGGGGYYGGGGGGSGIDAGGGGGGSCFVNITLTTESISDIVSSLVPVPRLFFINDTDASITWNLNWDKSLWGITSQFEIEMSYSPYSDDFKKIDNIYPKLPIPSANISLEVYYTFKGLSPLTSYRVRIIPIYSKGRGMASPSLIITTLGVSENYWESITTRRLSMAETGRGFSLPVLDRPHLSPGVEVFGERVNNATDDFSDGPTSEKNQLPSSRRGHSMSVVDNGAKSLIYMFGGRGDGYSCANVFIDLLNLGKQSSGRDVYPCVLFQGETSELWTLDVHTYKWAAINTTKWDSIPPPPREQHAAVIINGDLYIYGGKTRFFTFDDNGNVQSDHHSDFIYDDIWKLNIERTELLKLPFTGSPQNIPFDRRLFLLIDGSSGSNLQDISDGISPREGKCIDKVVVTVSLFHPCINQLRITLIGPGSQTASPNFFAHSASHEVTLYNQRKSNGTGCVGGNFTFIFDEDSVRSTDECCSNTHDGRYRPEGRLSEFIGASTSSEWNLVVQDMRQDSLEGVVLDWDIEFIVSPCIDSYTWVNLTSTMPSAMTIPLARYQAKIIAYHDSLFIFGGQDEFDNTLNDVNRYDTLTNTWTSLEAVNFDIALTSSSSVGSSFMLTSWGLLRYGGYFREARMPSEWTQYVSDVYLLDPVTLRWREVEVSSKPMSASGGKWGKPAGRYLAGAEFISNSKLSWKKKFGYRTLIDQQIISTKANFAGSTADSIVLFGGHSKFLNIFIFF